MVIIVIWFLLGIWFWLTVVASKLGQVWMRASFPEKKWAGAAGAFIGFMLLMGGWWVYWGIEYLQVRYYAKQMCQQAGVKVYITLEEWKEAYETSNKYLNNKRISQQIFHDGEKIFFQSKEYNFIYDISSRISMYSFQKKEKDYINILHRIYYDKEERVILVSTKTVVVNYKYGNSYFPKPWINNISQCNNHYYELIKNYSPPDVVFR